MANQYAPQQTLQYSLFIKRALVESMRDAWKNHPDSTVSNARVSMDFGLKRWSLPGVVVKFYERKLPNAGVGHYEMLPSPQDPDPSNPTLWIKYYHRFYTGDIGFEIYGASSVDRDLVRDAFIESIAMNDATTSGTAFLVRFYQTLHNTPYGLWHFPVLMWDDITGYGEQTMSPPWKPEDPLVYKVEYRVPIFGEFYSNTPELPTSVGTVQEVDVYPWIDGIDPSPDDNPNVPGAPGWYRFTGWPPNSEYI